MVIFELPNVLTREYLDLLPSQKVMVEEMMKKGLIQHYSISVDEQKIWVQVRAVTDEKMIETINKLPLTAKLKYSFTELVFSLSASASYNTIILN